LGIRSGLALALTSQITSHIIAAVKERIWPVQDAKARFSELLHACERDGPQIVTRRGEETAVLVPIEEWRRLRHAARPSLKALLLSDAARADLSLPARGSARRRALPDL
jgi:antitoxin Phd